MRKEFLVERQGKTFCLYSGLLALAHEQGLKSIVTTLVQVPHESNKNVAICTACVTLEKEGKVLAFSGIGDAAQNNVAPAMQTCLIRMAETRAKARALRDAVNVGMAALEELGDGEDAAPDRGYETRQGRGRTAPAQPGEFRASQARTPAASAGQPPVNNSGNQCTYCKAPEGKPHLRSCSTLTKQTA